MTPARQAIIVLMLIGTAALGTRQLESAQGEPEANAARATFAGGCFWCMEPPFDKLDGVISTTSGYIGGHVEDPTYKQVSSGTTGHTEAVEVVYDPRKVTYAQLLDAFWRNIDPLTPEPPVLRPRVRSTARGSSITTPNKSAWRANRSVCSKSLDGLIPRS